jgi:hypothetical protein
MDLIPTDNSQRKTWLVDLSGNIAISDAGVALLDAQVNQPEKQPSASQKAAESWSWWRKVVMQFNTGDYLD